MRALKVLFVLSVVALYSGCAHILIQPQANSVKKLAIVSVYMNRDIYDIEAPKKNEAKGLGALVKAAGKAATTEVLNEALGDFAGFQPVVTFGLKTFSENLNAVDNWEVIPPTEVVANPAYQEFLKAGQEGAMGDLMKGVAKLVTADFVAPEGMIRIPLPRAVESQQMRDHLAKLAGELGVDGVAIVQMDAGYEYAFIKGLVGADRATPSVSAAAVIVTKDAQLAMQTPLIRRAQGDRYEGETLGMVRKGHVVLKDPEVQSSFNQAFQSAAQSLRERIVEEFTGG